MENIGSVIRGKKVYGKPITSRYEMDKNICDDMCGMLGAIVTSTNSYQQYQICVHFPQQYGNSRDVPEALRGKYTYSSYGGTVRKLTMTGKHTIEFAGAPTGVDCTSGTFRSNGYTYDYGCGWQQYSTQNNGNCHYFGIIKIDGQEIKSSGSLPDGVQEGGW